MKVEIIQELLKGSGHYAGIIDGNFGSKTRAAVRSYYKFPSDWSDERLTVGCIQVICIKNNLKPGEIDGRWGRNTQQAYEELLSLLGKKEKSIEVNQNIEVNKSYNRWPKQDYNSMVEFYGKVGTNQTSLILPYPMVLAWDTGVTVVKITCHQKCKEVFGSIFEQTLKHYGIKAIKELKLDSFGGCLNVRKTRGGNSWSKHSWGCAYDLDPNRNQLKWGRDKAYFARAEYDPYWKIVEAMGGYSLGRERNFDFMHVEMTRQ